MKVYDIVMAADINTRITVRIKLYETKFETTHYAEWFLDNDELLEKRVTSLAVIENVLVLDVE